MWTLLRPILFLFQAETAHHLATAWLRLVSFFWRVRGLTPQPIERRPVDALGLRFANPVGLAAGFDKGVVVPEALFGMGFGFIEIGTVTPRPQAGNPRPRLFRLAGHGAIINRMGFNNPGVSAVAARLAKVKRRGGPIWLNIGKNKDTPNERAADDYIACIHGLYAYADAFVVNISSPNTPGLRDLQAEEVLEPLLAATLAARDDAASRHGGKRVPVLLKLSPDLADAALPGIFAVAQRVGLAGLIATNTTLARPVADPKNVEAGGFSGPALRQRATAVLRQLAEANARLPAAERLLLVGVGGITTAADANEKLTHGATLVEVYTSLIYGGPSHIRRLLRAL